MSSDRANLKARFLKDAGWAAAEQAPLAGDASTRSYQRLALGGRKAVLMDAPPGTDGPPLPGGRPPYSKIAHIAEDCRAFVAIGTHLAALDLSAPEIFAADIDNGFLLLEDLGDGLMGPLLDGGADPQEIYAAAVDLLLELHRHPAPGPLPLPDGTTYTVPPYDPGALQIEADLYAEWFLAAKRGAPLPPAELERYRALWAPAFELVAGDRPVLTLRDYHSPNILWLPDRPHYRRIGLIDFQDGLVGHPAYDLVSLLQDARRDVPEVLEAAMLERYIAGRTAQEAGFDAEAFRAAYAILGAQRNAKIIGIFTRLCQRDGKPRYLAHIPRLDAYLDRGLAHPALAGLKAWADDQLPAAERRIAPDPASLGT